MKDHLRIILLKIKITYELLSPNRSVNPEKYHYSLNPLNRSKINVQKKRPKITNRKGVIFTKTTNSKSYVSLQTL